MTYVVTENCIKCKYMDCVEVCPVDCFYVGENMLVIHPDECIDCGVCEPECPAEAIVPDSDDGRHRLARAEPHLRRNGPTSPARAIRRPTPRSLTARLASLENISPTRRARVTDPRLSTDPEPDFAVSCDGLAP